MFVEVLKSKIHRAKITDAHLDYVGSITIDTHLMKAANLIAGEKVQVLNVNNGARLETYVLSGTPNSGEIILNGPAARKAQIGDLVVIVSYALLAWEKAPEFQPSIIHPDKHNRIS